MLKAIIVDDEFIVRVGLKSLINWEQIGLSLVGEASNGFEAIELLEQAVPDIILLDIKMPHMNGLEVLEEIRRRHINTQVIILSCYDDYAYVRQAMKLGAIDYILKLSMTTEELHEILQKTCKSILDKQPDVFSLPISACHYLPGNCEAILSGSTNVLIAFFADENNLSKQDSTVINAIIHESIKDKKNFNYIERHDRSYIICSASIGEDEIFNLAGSIIEIVLNFLSYTIHACISDPFCGEDEFDQACKQCGSALKYAFYNPGEKVLKYISTRDYKNSNPDYSAEFEKNLISYLEEASSELINPSIDQFFTKISQEKCINPEIVKMNAIELFNLFKKHIDVEESVLIIQGKEMADILSEITNAPDINALRILINDYIVQMSDYYIKTARIKEKREIKHAKKFIDQHFNQPITLSEIARHVHVSKNYFCHLFKKETGEGVIDYINRIRVEMAIKYLNSGEYKIYEVSNLVGFNGTSYFSKIFKKYVGITPNEYVIR